jgi:para-nitrobenzyl esterase
VVTVSYRLGPFGFLAHSAFVRESPRVNYGLLDQQLALQFVNANAPRLGVDSSRITLFGESAGAVSVCLHLIMPGSYGLFQRAIMESGPCTQINLFESVAGRLPSICCVRVLLCSAM